jgi:hypothetical protein
MTILAVLSASLFPLCVWARRKWVLPQRAEIAALTAENRLADAPDGDLPEAPRVYRLNRSWRNVNILAAVLFLGTAAALLAGVCLRDSAWGGQAYTAWDYGISCVTSVFLLTFGVLGLTTVVTSKVVVSRDGIAYHTFPGILEADWEDWFDVQLDENDVESGVSMSVRPLHPKVTLRTWTSYLPWDVRRNMIENGIAVSRFGDANGRRLRQDIQNCLAAAAKQHGGAPGVSVSRPCRN